MTTGEKIRRIRQKFGYTQEQFANQLSVSRQAIAKWEADRGIPDIENLKAIANMFNVSVDDLINNSVEIEEIPAQGNDFEGFNNNESESNKNDNDITPTDNNESDSKNDEVEPRIDEETFNPKISKKTIIIGIVAIFLTFAIILTSSFIEEIKNRGKIFESQEDMLSEMKGTYVGQNEHSGERVIITDKKVVSFNVDEMFPVLTDSGSLLFAQNFLDEDWETFDLKDLLSKSYITVSSKPISVNLKKSTILNYWIGKDGILYSEKGGFPFKKESSKTKYPTDEMIEKFDDYHEHLQEYEIKFLIDSAEKELSRREETIESAITSAEEKEASPGKSNASAEQIANCAFDSLKEYMKYPGSASIEKYSTSPIYDSYGRVGTIISVHLQNGLGIFVSEDYFVVLQSCDSIGHYTFIKNGKHFIRGSTQTNIEYCMLLNDWEKDPNYDSSKDPSYLEAVQAAKDGEHQKALDLLSGLGNYRKAESLKDACTYYLNAQKYKDAVDTFAKSDFEGAIVKLTDLLDENDGKYIYAERVKTLCEKFKERAEKGDPVNVEEMLNRLKSDSKTKTDSSKETGSDSKTSFTSSDKKTTSSQSKSTGSSSSSSGSSKKTTSGSSSSSGGSSSKSTSGNSSSGGSSSKSTSGSGSSTSQSSSSDPCANGHKWVQTTKTIHHDEEGHYQSVAVGGKVKKYKCCLCYQKFSSLTEYYDHYDSVHMAYYNNDHYITMLREEYSVVDDYEYTYEQQWVVDREAYDEVLKTGYKCSVCGKTK